MSEASVVDFAGLDAAASSAAVDSAVTETSTVETSTDTQTDISNTSETTAVESGKEKAELNTDGSPKDALDKSSSVVPEHIRGLLRTMRDADVKNATAVKELHAAYERWRATTEMVGKGGYGEIKAQNDLLREISGTPEGTPVTAAQAREAISNMQGTVQAAQESDTLLYEGSKTLIDNVVSDLTTQGKLDALGKLLPHFAEAAREHDPQGFVAHQRSLFLATAAETGLTETLNSVYTALSKGDSTGAMAKLKSVGAYFNELQKAESDKAREAEIVKRERGQLETQKNTQQTAERTQATNQIAKVCDSHNNKLLGAELAPFLKEAFFRGYGKDNLMPLGNTLKQALYAALKADATYQAAMKTMWAAPKPDQSKIEAYHKSAVSKIAKQIVTSTVDRMYPGHKGGTAAAGRVAGKAAAAAPKAAPTSPQNAKMPTPIKLSAKPARNLIDFSVKDADLLMITGRAYLKDGRFVSWR